MDGWMDGRTDGRTDGWMDGQMDGWMYGWTVVTASSVHSIIHPDGVNERKVTLENEVKFEPLQGWRESWKVCFCMPSRLILCGGF